MADCAAEIEAAYREQVESAIAAVEAVLAGEDPQTKVGNPVQLKSATATLDEATRSHLFEPHIGVDRAKGTMRIDLTLSFAFQSLHKNGAELSVGREPSGGTAFRILFEPASA